jgi:hypothetical protein
LEKEPLPVVKKITEKGDILTIKAESAIIHSSEDNRRDFKVTITLKQNTLPLIIVLQSHLKRNCRPQHRKLPKARTASAPKPRKTKIYI